MRVRAYTQQNRETRSKANRTKVFKLWLPNITASAKKEYPRSEEKRKCVSGGENSVELEGKKRRCLCIGDFIVINTSKHYTPNREKEPNLHTEIDRVRPSAGEWESVRAGAK